MTVQLPIENSNAQAEGEEPYPEGYLEALADCHALAVNLLNKAINGEDIKRCWDCNSWAGRCLKRRLNVIARTQACDLFTPKRPERDTATHPDDRKM